MKGYTRCLVIISLLFINTGVFAAKADSVSLKKAIAEFNTALVKKDTVCIKKLVSDKLNYGHSNAWVQTKREMIDDLYNGKLTYTSITQEEGQLTMEGNTACVRAVMNIGVVMEGKAMQFKLNVLQTWVWKNGWQLFGRQSVKI